MENVLRVYRKIGKKEPFGLDYGGEHSSFASAADVMNHVKKLFPGQERSEAVSPIVDVGDRKYPSATVSLNVGVEACKYLVDRMKKLGIAAEMAD